MFCNNCGSTINNENGFCSNCGNLGQVENNLQGTNINNNILKKSRSGIYSIVFGVTSLVTSPIIYISVIFGVLGIVFGAKEMPKSSKGIIGLILGIIGILLALILIFRSYAT